MLAGLIELADETGARQKFRDMAAGYRINNTENRAALHTAARQFSDTPLMLDGVNVAQEMKTVRQQMQRFSDNVQAGTLTGSAGKPFTDAVIVGIGGSYLGCEFVYTALKHTMTPAINLHFLSNVDINNFAQVTREVTPDTTLWIVISKSYTTTETMANLAQVKLYLAQNKLDTQKHLVTITAKGSPGDDPSQPVLECFHMFDFIGGRYSVTSAVGGVPLSLAFGYQVFERFLKGCEMLDHHALDAESEQNIPLLAALINIWNSNFCGYSAMAIIPYCTALSRLAPHIQQLSMESLGKNATAASQPVDYPTGTIIFGEPGTNAQHSFFQLAHQGQAFPVEFIGVIKPAFQGEQAMSKGVYNHQELWANMIAQANALVMGKDDADPARYFEGNRPSSTLLINDLSPESLGSLLSFYEAKTVYEGFILGINPFDQFGVELGKKLASEIRTHLEKKNQDPAYQFHDLVRDPVNQGTLDPVSGFYLDVLFKGRL